MSALLHLLYDKGGNWGGKGPVVFCEMIGFLIPLTLLWLTIRAHRRPYR